MTTDLTVKNESMPVTFDEIKGMAEAFFKSGMFSDVKAAAQAIVKIQAGRELGLPPVYSMQNINMIRDRLTSSANTLAMLVKRSGRYNYRIKVHTEQLCTITFFETDGGKWVEVGESTFSMEDAKRANLVKPESGWAKFPRAMLFSRSISQGARIYCPDAIGGIYTDEEIRSIPPRPEEENGVEETPPNAPETQQDKRETPPKAEPKQTPGQVLKDLMAENEYGNEEVQAYMVDKFGKERLKDLKPEEMDLLISDVRDCQIKRNKPLL